MTTVASGSMRSVIASRVALPRARPLLAFAVLGALVAHTAVSLALPRKREQAQVWAPVNAQTVSGTPSGAAPTGTPARGKTNC